MKTASGLPCPFNVRVPLRAIGPDELVDTRGQVLPDEVARDAGGLGSARGIVVSGDEVGARLCSFCVAVLGRPQILAWWEACDRGSWAHAEVSAQGARASVGDCLATKYGVGT